MVSNLLCTSDVSAIKNLIIKSNHLGRGVPDSIYLASYIFKSYVVGGNPITINWERIQYKQETEPRTSCSVVALATTKPNVAVKKKVSICNNNLSYLVKSTIKVEWYRNYNNLHSKH